MFAFLRYVSLIPILIQVVQAAVQFVESVRADSPGPEKKAAVMDSLAASWGGLQNEFKITVPFSVLGPIVSFLIDLAVSVYNAVGYFRKKEAPAPAG